MITKSDFCCQQPSASFSGLLLLDKPEGYSSNKALTKVKKAFNQKKAGHTGTLDPLASGLLPICLGEATKFAQWLTDLPKIYQVSVQLGITTSTGDREGEVLSNHTPVIPDAALQQQLCQQFTGKLQQIPPMYSALKHQGQPLYRLARKGIDIERPPREITVYEFLWLKQEGAICHWQVRCSKGTYIRSLAEDVGEALGCGASVTALRRVAVGSLDSSAMHSLAEIEAKSGNLDQLQTFCLGMDATTVHLPEYQVNEQQTQRLFHGLRFTVEQPDCDALRIYDEKNRFLGIGKIEKGLFKAKRLISSKPRSA